MRTIVKKQRKGLATGKRGGKFQAVVKLASNGKGKKSKILISDWQHLTKEDADVLVHLVNTPARPNQAMVEARARSMSIPQLEI